MRWEANRPVSTVLSRLDRVRKSGGKWTARCPAHEDRNPSLSVAEGHDDRILLNCFAGCSTESVVGAIGMRMTDLFVEPTNGERRDVIAEYP